jgi:hypothetical protein
MNVGSTASLPLPGGPNANQSIVLRTTDGEVIEVAQQVQLCAPNSLLKHPLACRTSAIDPVLHFTAIGKCSGLFSPLIDGLVGLIGPGLHTRSDFRCVMRRRIFTQLSSTLRGTCSPRHCTFKSSMVYPHC